jgi:hypothetical protein
MLTEQAVQGAAKPVARKPYVKPKVEQVRLVLEEAVLGFCKGVQANGANVSGPCFPGPCTLAGS